jgi:hypothetical protein
MIALETLGFRGKPSLLGAVIPFALVEVLSHVEGNATCARHDGLAVRAARRVRKFS